MAVDPMIARGITPIGEGVANTLMQIEGMKRQREQDAVSQQRNALFMEAQKRQMQQQDMEAQREAEEDALWEQAYAAKDWGTMARIDPQVTKILWDQEQAQQPKAPEYKVVGDSLLQMPTAAGQDPRVAYRAPPNPQAGHGAMQEPFDVQTYRYFLQQPPEVQAKILEYRRGNSTPEIVAENTAAREGTKVTVAAKTDLPRVEQNAEQMLGALTTLEQSPGFKYLWGAYSIAPVVPGTAQADAAAVWEQVQGKAFLEAFNTLKGGGQITEKEGEKATAAITRLASRKQSEASARAAIQELRQVVNAARQRARAKARGSQAAPVAPQATPDPLGIR